MQRHLDRLTVQRDATAQAAVPAPSAVPGVTHEETVVVTPAPVATCHLEQSIQRACAGQGPRGTRELLNHLLPAGE
jgi:hypothetical protein